MSALEESIKSICSTGVACVYYPEILEASRQYSAGEADCNRNINLLDNALQPEMQRLARTLRCPYAVWEALGATGYKEASDA